MMSSSTQPDSPVLSIIPPQLPLPNISQLTITTFNCRGISSAIPYILHLIENGSDNIVLPGFGLLTLVHCPRYIRTMKVSFAVTKD